MAWMSNYSENLLSGLWNLLGDDLDNSRCMQSAAQTCVRRIYDTFSDSIVLVRLFMTIPMAQLPEPDQIFARQILANQDVLSLLNEETVVLSLLGTYGVESDWCNRYQSQSYLGIPLVTADFVSSMPMVATMMDDLGLGLAWLDTKDTDLVVRAMGGATQIFYVEDAKTAMDGTGRRIVAREDFVSNYNIKTVFGLGGSYVDGTLITILFFSRESIARSEVDRFQLLFNEIKQSSVKFILANEIFEG